MLEGSTLLDVPEGSKLNFSAASVFREGEVVLVLDKIGLCQEGAVLCAVSPATPSLLESSSSVADVEDVELSLGFSFWLLETSAI